MSGISEGTSQEVVASLTEA